MSRYRQHPLALLLACSLMGLAPAGCGSSGDEQEGEPLPRATAGELQKRLDEVERRYQDGVENNNPGACRDIQTDSFVAIDEILAGLPGTVDPDVRRAAKGSFENLRTLTEDGCADVQPGPETETETEPPPEEAAPEAPVPDVSEPEKTKKPKKPVPDVAPVPEIDDGGGDGGAVAPVPGETPGQDGTPGNGGGAQAPPAETPE